MAFLLCCWAPRSKSDAVVEPDSQRLRTLQPPSVVSVLLPSDIIPYRPATGIDETRALRDIFGASPSPYRGYQEAAKSSGSFDANFKFGNENPTRSRAQPQRSLDKLGQNIRQRLSVSRLSNQSSRKSGKKVDSTETVIHKKITLNSNTSTGLDDLLISRTVSEGGYDSDARGIRTPSWTKASAGSVLLSPEYTAKVLNSLYESPRKRSASLPRTPGNIARNDHSPTNLSRTPSTTNQWHSASEKVHTAAVSGRSPGVRASSSPEKWETPQRQSFSALLQLGPHESPSHVLRRLSLGLANGTIKLPDTPELKAMRMPSIVEAIPEWRLSFAAPKRGSSLHRADPEVRQALVALSDRVEKVKRDSVSSEWTPRGKHASLISNLDPALLQYICRYGFEEHQDESPDVTQDVEDVKRKHESFNQICGLESSSYADNSKLLDATSAEPVQAEDQPDPRILEERSHGQNIGLHSEKQSVHLFDMRISQRLASTSVLPNTSPSSKDLGSNHQYMDKGRQSLDKPDHLPTFGQTSGEHLRKPSDPSTRRLFEPGDPQDGRRLHARWKSVTSNSSKPEAGSSALEIRRHDGRSAYLSGAGSESGTGKSGTSPVRSRSTSNPYGRSVSPEQYVQGITPGQRRDSVCYLARGAPDQTSLAGSTIGVKGKESKFSEDFSVHERGTNDRLIQPAGGDDSANERMTMVDFLTTTDPNERMSEIDFAGALTQRLTSDMEERRCRDGFRQPDRSEGAQEFSNDGRREEEKETEFLAGKLDEKPTRTTPRGRDECATNMWDRALRSARKSSSFNTSRKSFGSSFGHLRRAQSREPQHSRSHTPHGDMLGPWNTVPSRQKRSLSPDADAPGRSRGELFELEDHQSLCAEAKEPLTCSPSQTRSIVKPKQKGSLDVRRFSTAGHTGNHDATKSISSKPTTPGRDFLAWARFPSHSRQERNGAAGIPDGVSTKDFSPATEMEMLSSKEASKLSLMSPETFSIKNHSKFSLMTQPAGMGVDTPKSWRLLKFGHGRKKSLSLNFEMSTFSMSEKEKARERARQKHPVFTLTRSLARWRRLYHSPSSDLGRFRAGHRSAIAKGGRVEFPELEIVPGFDGGGESLARVNMEQLGDFKKESRKQRAWRGRENMKIQQGREGGPLQQQQERCMDLLRGRITEATTEATTDFSTERFVTATTAEQASNATEKSSFRIPTAPLPPPSSRIDANGGIIPWAEIYQDCLVQDGDDDDDDDDDDKGSEPDPHSDIVTVGPFVEPMTEGKRNDIHGVGPCYGSSAEINSRRADSSYVSCSVGVLSDDDDGGGHGGGDDDVFRLHAGVRRHAGMVDCGRFGGAGGAGLGGGGGGEEGSRALVLGSSGDSSGGQRGRFSFCSSVVTGEEDEEEEEEMETKKGKEREKKSLLSSELRDSTVEFRAMLEEEERRVREGLVGGRGD